MRIGIWQLLAAAALAAQTVTSAAVSPASSSCGPSSRYVIGYYPTWKRNSLLNLDLTKLSHLQLAYAIPTDSGSFTFDGEWFLPSLVREAHTANTKISLTIGGWTGSNRFSSIMADTHKRGNLVKSIGDYLDKYELDGAEIDWEYPGRQGSKCNKYSSQDSANLMRFLHALRAHLHARFPDEQKLISLAVRVTPFDDSQGPMKDVSPFAEFVDYASIMAFDINGVWANTTGPNAPLRFTHNRGLPFSYTQAIDQWLEAKWPADKLVAGVPFYGRSLTTREVIAAKDGVDMYVPFSNEVPQGDLDDALWYDVCENVNSMSGIWNYRHLRDQGLLRSVNSTGEDWVRIWDKGSETPWLYNPRLRRMISYDDQESIARKVEYAKSKGIKGMMAWALHGDYQNELIGTVGGIGPLCRGEKTSNDQAASVAPKSVSASSESGTHASSSGSSVSAASASAASPGTSESASPHSWTVPSPFSTGGSGSSASAEHSSSNSASAASASTSAEPHSDSHLSASAESTSAAASSSVSAENSSGKAILFDSVGVPYAMVSGKSSAIPTEMADVLMKLGMDTASAQSSVSSASSGSESPAAGSSSMSVASESPISAGGSSSSVSAESSASVSGESAATASGESAASGSTASPATSSVETTGTSADMQPATGSLSFPVPDPAASGATAPTGVQRGPMPRRPGWISETNLFEATLPGGPLGGPGLGLPQRSVADRFGTLPSAGGFAATFLLPLDAAKSAGSQSATVLPLQQMIASRALEFSLSVGSSSKSGASSSASENASSSGASSASASSPSPASDSGASSVSPQASPATTPAP